MLVARKKKQEVVGKPHVKKNDEVLVLSGKDRGKRGKVLRVIASKGTAIVERVNYMKKSTRKNPAKNQQGGILETERPIRVDKLKVICPSCGEPSRMGKKVTDEGSVRVCKKCDTEITK